MTPGSETLRRELLAELRFVLQDCESLTSKPSNDFLSDHAPLSSLEPEPISFRDSEMGTCSKSLSSKSAIDFPSKCLDDKDKSFVFQLQQSLSSDFLTPRCERHARKDYVYFNKPLPLIPRKKERPPDLPRLDEIKRKYRYPVQTPIDQLLASPNDIFPNPLQPGRSEVTKDGLKEMNRDFIALLAFFLNQYHGTSETEPSYNLQSSIAAEKHIQPSDPVTMQFGDWKTIMRKLCRIESRLAKFNQIYLSTKGITTIARKKSENLSYEDRLPAIPPQQAIVKDDNSACILPTKKTAVSIIPQLEASDGFLNRGLEDKKRKGSDRRESTHYNFSRTREYVTQSKTVIKATVPSQDVSELIKHALSLLNEGVDGIQEVGESNTLFNDSCSHKSSCMEVSQGRVRNSVSYKLHTLPPRTCSNVEVDFESIMSGHTIGEISDDISPSLSRKGRGLCKVCTKVRVP